MKQLQEKLGNKPTQTERKNYQQLYARLKKRKEHSHHFLHTEPNQETNHQSQLNTINNYSTLSAAPFRQSRNNQKHQPSSYLQKDFSPQMGNYLLNKFKKYVKNKKQKSKSSIRSIDHSNPQFNQTFNLEGANQSHMTCSTCCRLSRKRSIDSYSLIKNAKQKMLRLMQLKIAKQKQFSEVSNKIRARCLKSDKKEKEELLKYKLQGLEHEEWDQQWKQNLTLEIRRYRSRLMSKSKKQPRHKFRLSQH